MLIISKFKDYYDGVVNTVGMDKSLVYNRHYQEFVEIESKDYEIQTELCGIFDVEKFYQKYSFERIRISDYYQNELAFFIVGFCGKYYLGCKVYDFKDKNFTEYNMYITYDMSEIKPLINNEKKYYKSKMKQHQLFDEFVTKINSINSRTTSLKYNTPVFLFDEGCTKYYSMPKEFKRNKLIINPVLKDYEFYKVFDAFQAYQELSMYLGNVLISEKPIIEVEDKYKIAQYGFDKWSFRKEKER